MGPARGSVVQRIDMRCQSKDGRRGRVEKMRIRPNGRCGEPRLYDFAVTVPTKRRLEGLVGAGERNLHSSPRAIVGVRRDAMAGVGRRIRSGGVTVVSLTRRLFGERCCGRLGAPRCAHRCNRRRPGQQSDQKRAECRVQRAHRLEYIAGANLPYESPFILR